AAALATRARRALARPRRSRVLADVRPAPDLAHAPPRGRRGRSFFFMFSPAPGRARAPRRLRRERGAHSHGTGAVAFSPTLAPHRISPHASTWAPWIFLLLMSRQRRAVRAAALATRARRALARSGRSRVRAEVRPAPDLAPRDPRGRRGSFFVSCLASAGPCA